MGRPRKDEELFWDDLDYHDLQLIFALRDEGLRPEEIAEKFELTRYQLWKVAGSMGGGRRKYFFTEAELAGMREERKTMTDVEISRKHGIGEGGLQGLLGPRKRMGVQ